MKEFPPEEPNRTQPAEVLEQIKSNNSALSVVNLNNVNVTENMYIEMFDALERNDNLKVEF